VAWFTRSGAKNSAVFEHHVSNRNATERCDGLRQHLAGKLAPPQTTLTGIRDG
jgi:hypothetical protein